MASRGGRSMWAGRWVGYNLGTLDKPLVVSSRSIAGVIDIWGIEVDEDLDLLALRYGMYDCAECYTLGEEEEDY